MTRFLVSRCKVESLRNQHFLCLLIGNSRGNLIVACARAAVDGTISEDEERCTGVGFAC